MFNPSRDDTPTMRPSPRAPICLAICWVNSSGPMTFTSNSRRMLAAGMSRVEPPSPTPALLTRISTSHVSAFLRSPASVTSSFSTWRVTPRSAAWRFKVCTWAQISTAAITSNPFSARRIATSYPNPVPDPVMRTFFTTLTFRCPSYSRFSERLSEHQHRGQISIQMATVWPIGRWLGGRAPLSISMVAIALVARRRATVRRETCLPEHPAQVDEQLLVDVFSARRLKHFGFGTQRNFPFAIAFLGSGSEALQQRKNLTPLNVATGGMAEDFLDCVAMMITEVRVHQSVLPR